MKHIIEKKKNGCISKITITELEYLDDFSPVEIEIYEEYFEPESEHPENETACFKFYDKKELSKFIGALLHVQSKIK
jgi:hypothetical protein